jgi:hypothetical protein
LVHGYLRFTAKETAMAKLPKYSLSHNDGRERWELREDKTHRFVKAFETKADATAGGVLERTLGRDGGSVKIEKVRGGYQEERTFPRSADPRNCHVYHAVHLF